MVVIHIINGKVYLGDFLIEKDLREVTIEEAFKLIQKVVHERSG